MEEEVASAASASSEPLLRRSPRSEAARQNRIAAVLGRVSGQRGPPAVVRETAARQLEERRADWAYSRPVVAIDISWNLAFAVTSGCMLAATANERPNVPLRIWMGGYALQCFFHVVLVWLEYRRRLGAAGDEESGATAAHFSPADSGEDSVDSVVGRRSQRDSLCNGSP